MRTVSQKPALYKQNQDLNTKAMLNKTINKIYHSKQKENSSILAKALLTKGHSKKVN